LLGAVLNRTRIDNESEVHLDAKASPCCRYFAITSTRFPTLLLVYCAPQLRFTACLSLLSPCNSFNWHPTEALLVCSTSNSDHIYTWQSEGARSLPHPHGQVESVDWLTLTSAIIRGRRLFSVATLAVES
jgi:hypothetical protein